MQRRVDHALPNLEEPFQKRRQTLAPAHACHMPGHAHDELINLVMWVVIILLQQH